MHEEEFRNFFGWAFFSSVGYVLMLAAPVKLGVWQPSDADSVAAFAGYVVWLAASYALRYFGVWIKAGRVIEIGLGAIGVLLWTLLAYGIFALIILGVVGLLLLGLSQIFG